MKVVNIDELMSVCGYGTRETDANNGYGCNHPDQEDYEMLWKDKYGYTHRGYEEDDTKPKMKQGLCTHFSCPLAETCDSLGILKDRDIDLYNKVLYDNEDLSLEEIDGIFDSYELVIVNNKEIEKQL